MDIGLVVARGVLLILTVSVAAPLVAQDNVVWHRWLGRFWARKLDCRVARTRWSGRPGQGTKCNRRLPFSEGRPKVGPTMSVPEGQLPSESSPKLPSTLRQWRYYFGR